MGYVLLGVLALAVVWWLIDRTLCSPSIRVSPARIFSEDIEAPLEEAKRELTHAEADALLSQLSATRDASVELLKRGMSPMVVEAAGTANALKLIRTALEVRRTAGRSALEAGRNAGVEMGGDGHLKPDMRMAARGVAAVFSVKISKPYLNEAELRAEVANSVDRIAGEDLSAQQKMSAVWGALYAVEDRTDIYLGALQAYDNAVRNSANPPSTDRYEAAAVPYLVTVLMQYPDEYTRYVGFELASEQATPA